MKKTILLLSMIAFGSVLAYSQGNGEGRIHGISTVGDKGVTRTVAQIMANSEAVSPWNTFFNVMRETQSEEAIERISGDMQANPNALPGPRYPMTKDPKSRNNGEVSLFNPQTIGNQFATDSAGNIFPPDTTGAVGPTQIMSTTNNRVKVFNKDGTAGPLNTTLNSFFTSVGGTTFGTSDPRVTFDRITGRWFVLAITVNSPNRIVLGVSSGSVITSQSSFTFYFIQVPNVFCDYESLGVDAQGVYVGENTFNTALNSFLGSTVTVIQKSSVLSGGPIFSTRFSSGGTAATSTLAPRGVDNDDPNSTEGYIIGSCVSTASRLNMRKVFNANTTSPTMSATDFVLNTPTTATPLSPPNQGGAAVDTLALRVFHVQMHLNRKSGKRTIYLANNTRCTSNGTGSASGDRDGIRWYEVDPVVGGTPLLLQSGVSCDTAATAPLYFWMGSVAQSGQGHMALSCNGANSTHFIQVQAAGRLAGDNPGLTQPATLAFQSTSAYNPGLSRWGDYSAVALDPADDQTMWAFQEYAPAVGSWGTRCVRLIAPPPSPVQGVSPNALSQGQNVNLTVTGAGTAAGSEYFDTDASYPNRLQCVFSGAGITVNSISFSHLLVQQIVLNVTVAGNAAPGPYDLTITNPDNQSVVGVAVVTVSGGPTTETLAPTSEQILLGNPNSGGNLGSWAADDANERKICKFFVPTATSPFIRVNLNYTTTKASPTAISFNTKVSSKTGGGQAITMYVQDKTNSSFVVTSVNGAAVSVGTTYPGVPTGTLANYLGGGGAMTGRIEVQAVGLQATAFPCTGFEFAQMVVTG